MTCSRQSRPDLPYCVQSSVTYTCGYLQTRHLSALANTNTRAARDSTAWFRDTTHDRGRHTIVDEYQTRALHVALVSTDNTHGSNRLSLAAPAVHISSKGLGAYATITPKITGPT